MLRAPGTGAQPDSSRWGPGWSRGSSGPNSTRPWLSSCGPPPPHRGSGPPRPVWRALRSRSARGDGVSRAARVLEASGMMRHVDFSEQRIRGAGCAGSLARRNQRARPPVKAAAFPARRRRPHLPGTATWPWTQDAHGLLPGGRRGPRASQEGNGAGSSWRPTPGALRGHVDQLAAPPTGSRELVVLFVG